MTTTANDFCIELDGQTKMNFFNEEKYLKEICNAKDNTKIVLKKFGNDAILLKPLDECDNAIIGFTKFGNVIYDYDLLPKHIELLQSKYDKKDNVSEPYIIHRYRLEGKEIYGNKFDGITIEEAYIGETNIGIPVIDYDLFIKLLIEKKNYSKEYAFKIVDEYLNATKSAIQGNNFYSINDYNCFKSQFKYFIIFDRIEHFY